MPASLRAGRPYNTDATALPVPTGDTQITIVVADDTTFVEHPGNAGRPHAAVNRPIASLHRPSGWSRSFVLASLRALHLDQRLRPGALRAKRALTTRLTQETRVAADALRPRGRASDTTANIAHRRRPSSPGIRRRIGCSTRCAYATTALSRRYPSSSRCGTWSSTAHARRRRVSQLRHLRPRTMPRPNDGPRRVRRRAERHDWRGLRPDSDGSRRQTGFGTPAARAAVGVSLRLTMCALHACLGRRLVRATIYLARAQSVGSLAEQYARALATSSSADMDAPRSWAAVWPPSASTSSRARSRK